MAIQQAIDAPSFHTEHWPSSFWPRVARPGKVVLEGRFDDAVLRELTARGHKAEKGEEWSEGRLSARAHRGGRADVCRRQSARHAGLRGRPLTFGPYAHRVSSGGGKHPPQASSSPRSYERGDRQ